MKKLLTLCISALVLASCAFQNSNTTYSRAQVGQMGKASLGVIIAMENVKIDGNSDIGVIAGGVAGAAAGSMVGGNTAVNIIGGVGGAVAGGLIGGAVQKAATGGNAVEFIVQQDKTDELIPIVQSNELNLQVGDRVILVTVDGMTRIRQKVGYQAPSLQPAQQPHQRGQNVPQPQQRRY